MEVGEAFGFSTVARKEPDLRLAFFAGGEEGDGAALRTPAGVRGGDASRSERKSFAAGGGHHPDALFVLVFVEEGGLDCIGDETGVRAELGIADGANPEIVVNGDGSGSGGRYLGKSCGSGYQN
jgi:hypothetical protein